MGNINGVISSFNDTLLNSKLADVTEDVLETLLDRNINDGLIKDIPIIGTLVGIVQTTENISNYLFLRKIAAFLSKVKDMPPGKRKRVIQAIDDSGKYREKVGVTVLSIIDKCDSIEKAEYIAILFREFIKENIEYECFMYGSHIIQRSYLADFKEFVYSCDTWKMTEDATDEMCLGLYYLDLTINLNEYRREILGYGNNNLDEIGATITDMGVTLRNIFQEAYDDGLLDE